MTPRIIHRTCMAPPRPSMKLSLRTTSITMVWISLGFDSCMCMVWGAPGFFGMILQELITKPALGKPGRIPHGDAVIGWSFMDDPARAAVMVSKVLKTKTRSYSVMGDPRSVRKRRLMSRRFSLMPISACYLGLLPGIRSKFDTRLIQEEIGYRPEWSMERGSRRPST